jgi:uncharacterized protein (DUF924 family)
MEWMVSFSKNRFVIRDQAAEDQAADVLAAEEVQEVSEVVVLPAAEVQNVPAEAVQAALVVLTLAHPEDLAAQEQAVQVQAQAVVHVY